VRHAVAAPAGAGQRRKTTTPNTGETMLGRTVLGRGRYRFLLALTAIACGAAGRAAVAAEDIMLGNIAAVTSPTAGPNARSIGVGYNTYLEHINRQGGIHGRNIKLLNKDDGVVVEKMFALMEELVADKRVIALAGFLNTPGLTELTKTGDLVKNKIAMIGPVGAFNAANFYPVRPSYNEEVEKLLAEARDTQKKRVALVYFNQTFGPPLSKFAAQAAKRIGVNIVASESFEAAPDKIEASTAATAKTVAKADPDAIIIMSAGIGTYTFTKKYRETDSRYVQLYALSPTDPSSFVKVAGLENARAVVISQAIPYPQHNALGIVREYQRMMKQYAPHQPLTFYGLEGYIGAKIAVEAIRRAGPNPTREKVIAALNTMKEYDLGDFLVSYTPAERVGSRVVDLTIIGKNGTLYR
jgi:ABC-type branched-subunit amino acid transport system substrate-binding protein